ncbi:MAG TPA: DUF1552 domain-containing protein [Polyangia bacterium]|jgi:hypothetical protein|nr:DUF1552 domain-containing protein [Polyangia bacterium]
MAGAGAGLAAASLPWSLRQAHAAGAPPLRFIAWPMFNGAEDPFFLPSAGNLAAMSTVTEPLKNWQKQITFVTGVNMSGSENHFAVRSMFSGATIPDYTSPDPTAKSIDQLIADKWMATAPTAMHSLHLGVIPADAYNLYQLKGRSTLFFAPKPVDYEANPVTAYDRTFGAPSVPTIVRPDFSADVNALLDKEMGTLSTRLQASTAELAKLKQHQDALVGLRSKPTATVTPPNMVGMTAPLPSVEKLRTNLQGNPQAAYRNDYYSDMFDAQVDILARALVTGLTRVGTLQAGSADGDQVDPVGPGYPHHGTSHGDQTIFAQCQRWYMTKLARLLAALDVPDPLDPTGKTVLYNSVIVVMSECLPVTHSSNSVPTMLMGNGAGLLKAGSMISGNGVTNKAILQTVLGMAGVAASDAPQFGTQTMAELKG